MKILKFIWLLPITSIYILFAIYYTIKVFNNSNLQELQLMGSKQVAKEIFENWFEPILLKYKILLRIFSTLIWIWIIIDLFIK